MRFPTNIILCIILTFLLGAFFIFVPPAQAQGPTLVTADINTPTTWTREQSPYDIPANYQININSQLTIEPGVVVKFRPNHFTSRYSGLNVNGPGGQIIARGTSTAPVVFTSYWDNDHDFVVGTTGSPQVGDWYGLRFYNDDSVFEHTIIRYAGQPRAGHRANLEFYNSSRATVSITEVAFSKFEGIFADTGAEPVLDNVTLAQNARAVLSAGANAGPGVLKNSQLKDNLGLDLFDLHANSLFRFENNTDQNNAARLNRISGQATRHVIIPNLGLPYWGSFDVASGATVTIEPGTIFKNQGFTRRFLIEGALKAPGTAQDPIIFTSLKDDSVGGDTNGDGSASLPAPGDWGELYFKNSSGSQLDYVQVSYGGVFQGSFTGIIFLENHYYNVQLDNAQAEINNSVIQHSFRHGIYAHSNAQAEIKATNIKNNVYGLTLSAVDSADWTLQKNKIAGNANYGLSYVGAGQLDARGNFWGDPSGPTHPSNPEGAGDKVQGDVLFDPWLGKINPVIIVPGIAGSELFHEGEEIWMNIGKMLFDVGDEFLDVLMMDEAGNSINEIDVGDIIREKLEIFETWTDFIGDLEDNGYQENEKLFILPYDWRIDNRQSADLLNAYITVVLQLTGAKKVDIVAHSMGGLVTKQYVEDHGEAKIDQIIFMGTPHYGSPKSLKILMFGDNFGIPPLNPLALFRLSLNMSTVYQLLPSLPFFSAYNTYFVDNADIDSNGVTGGLVYNEVNELLVNLGMNELLKDDATYLHSDLDDWAVSDELKSRIHNIVGCSLPTLGTFVSINNTLNEVEYYIHNVDGDETVPLESALGVASGATYYIPEAKHSRMPDNDTVRSIVLDVLDDNSVDLQGSEYEEIREGSANCGFEYTLQSVHSPVEIHAYDDQGNHTGPNGQGGIDEEIPGSIYEILGDEKFLFYPKGINITVTLKGLASGVFNYDISNITENGVEGSAKFFELPVTPTTTGEVIFDGSNFNQAIINLNSQVIAPSSVLNENESQDLTQPETELSTSGTGENGWFRSLVEVSLLATENPGGSGIWETRFSLDAGATWQLYASPFNLAEDGEHTVQYYSIDRAGNAEIVKESSIKIDLTPPEFDVYYDSSIKDVEFSSPGSEVTCGKKSCTAEDQAGNETELKFRKTGKKGKYVVKLKEIEYNGIITKFVKNNFTVNHTGTNKYFVINQDFTFNKNKEFVKGIYLSMNDETKVFWKDLTPRVNVEEYQGLKLIHVMTDKGFINWEVN